ncbi:hypothetical protein F4779DRAFT_582326 [Xylariaceae sp. FL0662B]|nr:hypothetical protein F4779DRAFT_582326 [Xylariaceae sp. FL0662B]
MSEIKFRSSCDACLTTKVRCSQTKPSCARCCQRDQECVYSQYRKIGRPSCKAPRPLYLSLDTPSHDQVEEARRTPHEQDLYAETHQTPTGIQQQLQHGNNLEDPCSSVPVNGILDPSVALQPRDYNVPFPEDVDLGTLISLAGYYGEPVTPGMSSPVLMSNSGNIFEPPTVLHQNPNKQNAAGHYGASSSSPSSGLAPLTPMSHIEISAGVSFDGGPDRIAKYPWLSFYHPSSSRPPNKLHSTRELSKLVKDSTGETNFPEHPENLAQLGCLEPTFTRSDKLSLPTNSQCTIRCHARLNDRLAYLTNIQENGSHHALDFILKLDEDVRRERTRILGCPYCLARPRCGQTLMLATMVMSKVINLLEQRFVTGPASSSGLLRSDSLLYLACASGPLQAGNIEVDDDVKLKVSRQLLRMFLTRQLRIVAALRDILAEAQGGGDISCKVAGELLMDVSNMAEKLSGVIELTSEADLGSSC